MRHLLLPLLILLGLAGCGQDASEKTQISSIAVERGDVAAAVTAELAALAREI